MRRQSQPRLIEGAGASQKYRVSSTAGVQSSLQRLRITGRPLQHSLPRKNDGLNLLYKPLSNLPADVAWQLKDQLAFVGVKLYCTVLHSNVAYWSKFYVDFNPHRTTTMKANVSFQPSVQSVQVAKMVVVVHWVLGLAELLLPPETETFPCFTLLFSGDIKPSPLFLIPFIRKTTAGGVLSPSLLCRLSKPSPLRTMFYFRYFFHSWFPLVAFTQSLQ